MQYILDSQSSVLPVLHLITKLQCHNSSLNILFGHFCMYQLWKMLYKSLLQSRLFYYVEQIVLLLDSNLSTDRHLEVAHVMENCSTGRQHAI